MRPCARSTLACDRARPSQMSNRYLGYVCLVDPHGIVRWHVHGNEPPTTDELVALQWLVAHELRQERAAAAENRAKRRVEDGRA